MVSRTQIWTEHCWLLVAVGGSVSLESRDWSLALPGVARKLLTPSELFHGASQTCSVGLEWGQRFCISNKAPGDDVSAADSQSTLLHGNGLIAFFCLFFLDLKITKYLVHTHKALVAKRGGFRASSHLVWLKALPLAKYFPINKVGAKWCCCVISKSFLWGVF